jgi:hypothetical protein
LQNHGVVPRIKIYYSDPSVDREIRIDATFEQAFEYHVQGVQDKKK